MICIASGKLIGKTIIGREFLKSSTQAKQPGDFGRQHVCIWFFATSQKSSKKLCYEASELMLETCIEAAYIKYKFAMDDKTNIEESKKSCSLGYLDKCFNQAGSIPNPEDRILRHRSCVKEHCESDLFPEQSGLEPYTIEDSLLDDIINCVNDYRDRRIECGYNYNCP